MEKVTDPLKIVTDSYVALQLSKQGMDKDYVEFFEDYNTEHPYGKIYRDLKSNKRIMFISGLPRVKADGTKIQAGWIKQGNRYISKPNLFSAVVDGLQVSTTILEDHSKAKKAGDTLQYQPQLFLDGVEQFRSSTTLLAVDPVNPAYLENTFEWDYGICKRRLRIIEGAILGSWVFNSNPLGEVRIKYNQSGDYRLYLGEYKASEDEELVKLEDFDEQNYPFVVNDSDTSYSTADGHIVDFNPTYTAGFSLVSTYIGDGASAATSRYRSLFKWDFSGIDPSAIVSAVTLSIWEHSALDDAGQGTWACELYRILRNWVAGQCSWNNYSSSNAWTTAGAASVGNDIDGDISATVTLDATPAGDYVDWTGTTLTDDVQKIVDGTYANNYGWLLRSLDAEAKGTARTVTSFYAVEQGGTDNDPKLVITYSAGWSGGDVLGVAIATVSKINGVALADITKVNGVA